MPSPNWDKFFRERPDLEPPGYRETVDRMYPQEKKEEPEEEIEF